MTLYSIRVPQGGSLMQQGDKVAIVTEASMGIGQASATSALPTIDASRQSPSTKFARSGRVLRYCSRSSARRLKMRVEEKIAIWRSQTSYEVRDIDLVSHMHVEPLASHTGHEVSLLLR